MKSVILFAAPMVAAEERIHQLNPRPLDLLPSPSALFIKHVSGIWLGRRAALTRVD